MDILKYHDAVTEEVGVPAWVPVFGFGDDQNIDLELGEEILASVSFDLIDGSGVGRSDSERSLKDASLGDVRGSWVLFNDVLSREVEHLNG